MSTQPVFTSTLAEAMNNFVAFKRMQGYDYVAGSEHLAHFDRFLVQENFTGNILVRELFSRYLASTAGLSPKRRQNILSVIRQFSIHLNAYRPESSLVPEAMLPRQPDQIRFYPLSGSQIGELMQAALTLRPKHGIRPHCICFMIGLLYATGLRIREALMLTLGDVDTERSTVFVRKGKFNKERIITLSESTLEALNRWLALREHYASTTLTAPLLVSHYDSSLTYIQASTAFQKLCKRCGLDGESPPRLHDLRHNFACHCIARWRQKGQDVQALLPVLANAMGHVTMYATQRYIHFDAAALQQASISFNDYFKQQQETE